MNTANRRIDRGNGRGRGLFAANLLTGLVACWRLDSSGADASGNGNDLDEDAFYGGYDTALVLPAGGAGRSVKTPSELILVNSPLAPLVNPRTDGLTLCVWVKSVIELDGFAIFYLGIGDADSSNYVTLIVEGFTSEFTQDPTFRAGINVRPNVIGTYYSGESNNAGFPAFVCWRYSPLTSQWTVWIDGAGKYQSVNPVPPNADLGDNLFGFPGEESSVNNWFDQICLWKRALSDAEVSSLYNGGSGRDPVLTP